MRSRLIKALNNRFYVKFMQLEKGLFEVQKKFEVNLEVSEVLITHVTYRGKARVMLHIGAGQSSNYQKILELSDGYCSDLLLYVT